VDYGRLVTSEYRAAVTTAAEVLGTGVQRMRAAQELLAEESLPDELAAALVAAHDQLDSALRRLQAALGAPVAPRGGPDTGAGRRDARSR